MLEKKSKGQSRINNPETLATKLIIGSKIKTNKYFSEEQIFT
jgi:hypothetical protein